MKKHKRLWSLLLTAVLTAGAMCARVSAAEEEEKIWISLNAGEFGHFEDPYEYEPAVEYDAGDLFRPEEIVPVPNADGFAFDGWYTGIQGKGVHYTDETPVDGTHDRLYANWKPVPGAFPVLEEDEVYPLSVSTGVIFAFTPAETGMYEIFTTGNDPYEGIPNIRVLDGALVSLAQSRPMDYDNNAIVSLELNAGTTYYVEFGSTFSVPIVYDAVARRSVLIPVTFHADPKNEGKAWFDGDPDKTVKTMDVRKGAHLESFSETGLEIDPSADMALDGWTLDLDAEEKDEEIILNGPVDVYAVYSHYKTVMVDANGGSFPALGEGVTDYKYPYRGEWPFEPYYGPVTEDGDRAFAGWATSPDATEPDILEGAYYEDVGTDRIYAVYAEKVTVTFDAGGGFIFGNEDLHTYQVTYGKGHVFYQLHVEYGNEPMELLGWIDQDGHAIPAGRDTDPSYQFMKDTVLTAVWGRYVDVCATEGCFHFNPGYKWVTILFPVDLPFDSGQIVMAHGEPVNFDDLQYLAGWATDPDLEEPDVLDGVTDVMGLTEIYAIWKEDRYYIADGADAVWEKGSDEGLTVTVKRTGDDTLTFSMFEGVFVDGERTEQFSRKEGSLILTLDPAYLETLEEGEHALLISFTQDAFVETAFTVRKAQDVPETGDRQKAMPWALVAGLAAAALVLMPRKRNTAG